MTGTVKTYHQDRGFGFVRNTEAGTDFFFHISDVESNEFIPERGDVVTFDVVETDKGNAAVNVRPVNQ